MVIDDGHKQAQKMSTVAAQRVLLNATDMHKSYDGLLYAFKAFGLELWYDYLFNAKPGFCQDCQDHIKCLYADSEELFEHMGKAHTLTHTPGTHTRTPDTHTRTHTSARTYAHTHCVLTHIRTHTRALAHTHTHYKVYGMC